MRKAIRLILYRFEYKSKAIIRGPRKIPQDSGRDAPMKQYRGGRETGSWAGGGAKIQRKKGNHEWGQTVTKSVKYDMAYGSSLPNELFVCKIQ